MHPLGTYFQGQAEALLEEKQQKTTCAKNSARLSGCVGRCCTSVANVLEAMEDVKDACCLAPFLLFVEDFSGDSFGRGA